MSQLLRRKSVDLLVAEATERSGLKRVLGKLELTLLGVGAIVGAGIFSSVGTAIAGSADRPGAGPALVVSLLILTLGSALAALCYAEFAAMIPAAGSAYTYAYATLGELVAWIIGWDLILEYAIGNVAVAISWAGYFDTLLRGFGIEIPAWLVTDYRTAHQAAAQVAAAADRSALSFAVRQGAAAVATAPALFGLPLIFNLPAVGIVSIITLVLVRGIKESAWVNNISVVIKVAVVLVFLAVGVTYVKPENWTPFAPNGFRGITVGAAIIFFAYIGFDAVSTAAEETRNPQKDMPFGIIASLIICTVLYIAIALVLTGIMPWDQLGVPDPLAVALTFIHADWFAGLVAFGAVMSMTSVLLVFQLGQPRIFFSMARDGLLPTWAAKVHPRFRTPHVTTIITGVLVAVPALFFNINEMVELTNIGTLFAFLLVALGILVLRVREPDRARPFRTPLVPLVPLAAIGICGFLMFQLPLKTWILFIVWLAIGLVIYFGYSHRHSRLRLAAASPAR
ncbi:MAG: amino acid permease [Gemmatimonadetes bacterium]|nr:amino acid permease [Gemmatimonadota bacterium]